MIAEELRGESGKKNYLILNKKLKCGQNSKKDIKELI